jgi:hypothetical protein
LDGGLYDGRYEYWNDKSWGSQRIPLDSPYGLDGLFGDTAIANTGDRFTYMEKNNPTIQQKFSNQQLQEFDQARKFFQSTKNDRSQAKSSQILASQEQYQVPLDASRFPVMKTEAAVDTKDTTRD